MSAKNLQGQTFLPVLCDTFPENIKLKAEKELNETEENIRQGLSRLKSFIEEEDLPVSKDDSFLLAFLRVRKFHVEEALKTVKNYAALRRKYLKYFAEADFDDVKLLIDKKVLGLLPYRDEEGTAIVYFRSEAWTSRTISAETVLNTFFPLFHFLIQYPVSSVSGFRIIADFPLTQMSHYFSYFKIALVYVSCLRSMPIRMKSVDIINQSRLCTLLINIVWHLVPKKLQERSFIHGEDIEALVNNFHPSILPEEFGGTQGSFESDFFMDEFREFYYKMKSQNMAYKPKAKAPRDESNKTTDES